ncbi:MAG: carbohydrate ABC transporter permease [Holophaga sp.]|nr:carbohydrate ABC transporter permease [Holophaga sp.]
MTPAPSFRPGRLRALATRGATHLLLLAVLALWLTPMAGLLVASFRPADVVATTGWWTAFSTPLRFTLENYSHVLAQGDLARAFGNSLAITLPATVMPILMAAFAAYAFAWMRFPGQGALFLAIAGFQVVPLQVTLIPVLKLFIALHLQGSFAAVWIAHTAYALPLSIYLLRNYMGRLPGEMLEAAAMEGANHAQIFFRIVLPTCAPALASIAIFQFMWIWNDLLVALIFVGSSPDVAPVTVVMGSMVNSQGGDWEYLTAAALVAMLLPLAVFFSLQRYFVKGIVAGSVKE